MKHLTVTFCFALSLCIGAWAQPAAVPAAAKPVRAHTMDPVARSNMLAKTGGLIVSPAEGPYILFLNTQKRVPSTELLETANHIQNILHLPCKSENKPSSTPVADALAALKDSRVAAVVVIGDENGYPSLLVAPENRWVMINVVALSDGSSNEEKLIERTQKELWRAFGYVMGAANSNFDPCLLKPVLIPSDLDTLAAKSLCPEPFNKILAQAKKIGIKPTHTTTYRKAVEEGWAPAPTNDFQRAIWNELKK